MRNTVSSFPREIGDGKRILMICYYFPPLTDVGCKRSVTFSKYFKKNGWNPYVLSVKNPDKTYCSLGDEVPPRGVHTEYSFSIINVYKFFGKLNGLLYRILRFMGIVLKRNYFYDIFCIPDIFWGWIPLTVVRGFKLIKKYNIDVIYVSCSPFSSAVIGVLLKKITKKSLILDFRDPYALETRLLGWLFARPKFRKKIDRWIESKLLQHTDIFITVTEELRKLYVDQYPQRKNKIFTIYNGFDAEFLPRERPDSKYPKFTISYVGDFYFYLLKSEVFFEGLSLLKNSGKINKDTFQFLFYGDGKNNIREVSLKYGIEDLVTATSRIAYKDILEVISSSHLQLIRVAKGAMPTKIFDGIVLNIPLLATIPTGDAEDIIRKYSPGSYIIKTESPEKVAEAILDAMEKYEKKEIQDNKVTEFLDHFSRENLTLRLMEIIDKQLVW